MVSVAPCGCLLPEFVCVICGKNYLSSGYTHRKPASFTWIPTYRTGPTGLQHAATCPLPIYLLTSYYRHDQCKSHTRQSEFYTVCPKVVDFRISQGLTLTQPLVPGCICVPCKHESIRKLYTKGKITPALLKLLELKME